MPRSTERRCFRTKEIKVALGRFLRTATLRLGYEALVLGDSKGRLIAWGGEVDGPNRLAGDAAARFASNVDSLRGNGQEGTLLVEPLSTPSGTYYLTVLGGQTTAPLRQGGTLQGIRRILHL